MLTRGDDAALGFGEDFLGDAENVSFLRNQPTCLKAIAEDGDEIIPPGNIGHVGNGGERNLHHRPSLQTARSGRCPSSSAKSATVSTSRRRLVNGRTLGLKPQATAAR